MSIELKIPAVGESIREVQIGQWLKQEGDRVTHDEAVVELETDKASMELSAPIDGVIARILKHDGDTVAVGEVIAQFEPDGAGAKKPAEKPTEKQAEKPTEKPTEKPRSQPSAKPQSGTKPKEPPPDEAQPAAIAEPTDEDDDSDGPPASPSVRRLLREHNLSGKDVRSTGEGGRLLREDVERHLKDQAGSKTANVEAITRRVSEGQQQESAVRPPEPTPAERPSAASEKPATKDDSETIVPMSLIRRRIAERLVDAQQNAALLTTFNEIDLSAVIELRTAYRTSFQEKYGVKLGFMSFFVKASVDALREFPAVNAEVRGSDIVYHNAYHIGVAIGGGKGLVVPVLRHSERLSFAEIEQAIDDFAKRAQSNKLGPEELTGGTFTISNGGIYGSLLSTPIVNPPQSGVLGMHAIQDRPVARDGQVVIRPMMYVALTYDHRIIDGRDAVSFLKHVKESIEAPARLLIGV